MSIEGWLADAAGAAGVSSDRSFCIAPRTLPALFQDAKKTAGKKLFAEDTFLDAGNSRFWRQIMQDEKRKKSLEEDERSRFQKSWLLCRCERW